jgi:hypothetical protein
VFEPGTGFVVPVSAKVAIPPAVRRGQAGTGVSGEHNLLAASKTVRFGRF